MTLPPTAPAWRQPASFASRRFRSPWRSERGGIIGKLLALLILLALVGLMYVGRHPLLRAAGRFLIVEDPAQASSAILMLSDDNYFGDRAARAAELFHAGWAPRVVASGRYLRPYMSIGELMQRDLTERGVPTEAVVVFKSRAENTREECTAVGQFLAERGWRRVLLVTSNYQTRRARYICERVLPSGTQLRVESARDSDYNPDSWWESRQGVKLFFRELSGMIVAMWELRHSPVQATEASARTTSAGPLPENGRRALPGEG